MGDQTKKYEPGGACGTCGEEERYIQCFGAEGKMTFGRQ